MFLIDLFLSISVINLDKSQKTRTLPYLPDLLGPRTRVTHKVTTTEQPNNRPIMGVTRIISMDTLNGINNMVNLTTEAIQGTIMDTKRHLHSYVTRHSPIKHNFINLFVI